MLIEAAAVDAVHWMQPADIDGKVIVGQGNSVHGGATLAAFVDGSVRGLRNPDPDVLIALLSISGAETLAPGDF